MNHRHRIFERLAGQLEYGDFYDIAAYGNENWKGSYTPKEVAQNAYDYYSDFKASKESGFVMYSISKLIELLAKDGSEDAKYWFDCLISELKMR